MSFELSAVRYMLSLEHPRLPTKQGDSNLYVLGELSGHNAVIACLPGSSGKGAAAIVATDMERTFPSVKHRLLVGIGGGVPSYNHDIRLGDVVVSMPNDTYGGVIQYDLGKDTDAGFRLKGSLPSPHVRLRSAVEMMRSDHMTKSNKILDFISDMLLHIDRPPRQSDSPIIHYGLVASGDRVMKSARKRDTISQEFQGNILCFEMEAAGLGANVPYMVIRGISDYSDSHKCDQWQHYAAATAAASAKEILSYLDPQENAADTKTKILSPPGVDESNSEKKKQSESLMESLKFDQIDGHQNNIKNANSKTCQWLLETSEYLEWLNDSGLDKHHGFLWVKGKPGTGKSTLMKFILANGNRQWQDKTIASFFFNARGQDLEKSTIGMYRSLLYQLLQKHPHLQSLNEANKIWTSNGGIYPKWSVEPLKELFIQAIQMLDEVSLVFFIDALDECYEPEIRDMMSFFEEVSDVSSSLQIQFRACFSSRHYPHITIRNGLNIVLENQQGHDNDINEYIIRELRVGGSRLSQLIKEELQQKSSGIFLWVVLVVKILNKEYDDGNVEDLQERLREIPADLHDLFTNIICRSEVNEKRLATCLQWVLFAKRPLAPEELYFAILSGIKPDSIKPWDEELVSEQTINRFILSSSKGLVGIKTSNYQLGPPLFSVPKVQFIHESVREFLLNESYLNSIWSTLEPGSRGQYHDNLKECCISYINQILSYWNSEISRPQIKSLTTRIFPFLGYCLQNIFYHANEAEKAGVSQKYFLNTFDHTKLIRLRNELRSKPLTSNASLLYLLAESNAPYLINIHPSRLDYLKIEDEKFGTPLFVALANGNEDSVKAFLQLDIENSNSSVAMLLSEICKTYRKGIYQSSSTFSNGGNILSRPLSLAAIGGRKSVVELLIETKKVDLDMKDHYGRTPLSLAACSGARSIVELLLGTNEVDVNTKDHDGRTLLSLAASRGSASVVEFLIATNLFDLDIKDNYGLTPLSLACIQSNDEYF
ncbi:Pfs, NB-ARC and ankyrin domain protein, partial [Talaromyces proteolyticus]